MNVYLRFLEEGEKYKVRKCRDWKRGNVGMSGGG